PNSQKFRRDQVFMLMRPQLEGLMNDVKTNNAVAAMAHYAWPAFGGLLLGVQNGMEYDYASHKAPLVGRHLAAFYLFGLVGMIVMWRRRLIYQLLPACLLVVMVLGSFLTNAAPYAPRTLAVFAVGQILTAWVLAGLAHRVYRAWGCGLGR